MADKKISELPLLNAVSGSTIIVPIVHDGTTAKLNLSQLAQYSSQWSAKTGSANTFTGNQTVNGNLILNGNGVISGNVEVGGMITAQQYNVTYVSSSIQYQSGSTEFGDTADDTHTFTGTLILNGLAIGTAQLMAQTASQNAINTGISAVTGAFAIQLGSIDSHILAQAIQTGSQDLVNFRISSVTGSINTTTSSFNSVFLGISSVTGAMNTQSGSQNLINLGISTATGSLIGITNGLMAFTQSVNTVSGSYATTGSNNFIGNQRITGSLSIAGGQFNVLTGSGQLTSSLTFTHNITAPNDGNAILELRHNNDLYNDDIAIKLKADFAGAYIDYEEDGTPYSILSVQSFANKNVYIHQDTRLLFSNLTVDDNLIVKQNTQLTGSLIVLGGITGSLLSTNGVVSSSNQLFELNQQTGSQNSVNLGISTATGSLIGITNGLMAFTASLDNTYATDAQLYQLYQATASIHSTTASLNTQTGSQDLVNLGISTFTGSIRSEVGLIEAYTASLKAVTLISSSNQIFVNGAIVSDNTSQKILATNTNILYLYSGTSGIYINNQANDTTIAQFTNAGQLTIGGPGNDQNLVFGGTNSSIYWGSGGPARMYYNVGDIRISSNGAADVLNVKNIGGILVNGGITGSLMATNGVVSGSQQIAEYNRFAQTASANTFYGEQTISGSLRISSSLRTNIITGGLDVNGGITGSFKGNLAGVADYASTIVVVNTGTTTDTTLYPTFTTSPILAQYTSLYSHASSSFFYNGVTRRLHMEGFVVSGSNNTAEISGSLIVTGSSTITGSFLVSGSTTQIGNNTLVGNTVLSGSILVSGSSDFKNSEFRVTGSSFFTGSHEIRGNSVFSGSINIASGSSYYRAGNKLFNYGQWASLETQSGSADTAYAVKLGSTTNGSEGIYITNDGSGFPTRITAENTGLYNIQFSFQLNTTATETCDFSVWYSMTGSNVANSNTDFSIDKTAGGGNGVAALNFLTHITANDYVQIYWSKSTANGQLVYKAPQGTPTRPATPSAIVTITQVA